MFYLHKWGEPLNNGFSFGWMEGPYINIRVGKRGIHLWLNLDKYK